MKEDPYKRQQINNISEYPQEFGVFAGQFLLGFPAE